MVGFKFGLVLVRKWLWWKEVVKIRDISEYILRIFGLGKYYLYWVILYNKY